MMTSSSEPGSPSRTHQTEVLPAAPTAALPQTSPRPDPADAADGWRTPAPGVVPEAGTMNAQEPAAGYPAAAPWDQAPPVTPVLGAGTAEVPAPAASWDQPAAARPPRRRRWLRGAAAAAIGIGLIGAGGAGGYALGSSTAVAATESTVAEQSGIGQLPDGTQLPGDGQLPGGMPGSDGSGMPGGPGTDDGTTQDGTQQDGTGSDTSGTSTSDESGALDA